MNLCSVPCKQEWLWLVLILFYIYVAHGKLRQLQIALLFFIVKWAQIPLFFLGGGMYYITPEKAEKLGAALIVHLSPLHINT